MGQRQTGAANWRFIALQKCDLRNQLIAWLGAKQRSNKVIHISAKSIFFGNFNRRHICVCHSRFLTVYKNASTANPRSQSACADLERFFPILEIIVKQAQTKPSQRV